MAKADWNEYLDADITAQLNLTGTLGQPDPPVGTSWLYLDFANVGPKRSAVYVPIDPPYAHGITRGIFRSLFQLHQSSISKAAAGLAFLIDQEDMRDGAGGTGYAVVLELPSAGPTERVQLWQLGPGAGLDNPTILATSTGNWTQDTLVALEVQFNADDVVNIGGTWISVLIGTQSDFSDLSPIAALTNIVDTTSPIVTSIGEALVMFCGVGGGIFRVYVDQTSLEGP